MKQNSKVIAIFFSSLFCVGLFGNCAPAPFAADGNGQPYEGETPFRTSDVGFGEELEEPEAPGDPVNETNQMVGNGLAMEGFGRQSHGHSNFVDSPLVALDSFAIAPLVDAPLSSKNENTLASDKNNKKKEKEKDKEKPSKSDNGKKEISYYMEDNAFSEGSEFIEDNSFATEIQEEEVLVAEEAAPIAQGGVLITEEESDDQGSTGEAGQGGESDEGEDSPELAAEAIEAVHGLEEVIYSCIPDSPGFVDKVEFGLIAGETGMSLQTLSGDSHSNIWEASQPAQIVNRIFDSGERVTEVTLLHPLVIVSYSDAMGAISQELILCDGPTVAESHNDTMNLLTSDISPDRKPGSVFEE